MSDTILDTSYFEMQFRVDNAEMHFKITRVCRRISLISRRCHLTKKPLYENPRFTDTKKAGVQNVDNNGLSI